MMHVKWNLKKTLVCTCCISLRKLFRAVKLRYNLYIVRKQILPCYAFQMFGICEYKFFPKRVVTPCIQFHIKEICRIFMVENKKKVCVSVVCVCEPHLIIIISCRDNRLHLQPEAIFVILSYAFLLYVVSDIITNVTLTESPPMRQSIFPK